jgi:hypothetical protein
MKNVLFLAVASLVATSANAAEMKWNGGAGWRYSQTTNNDSLGSTVSVGTAGNQDVSKQTTKAHQVRANLGATGGWENVEWGLGMRTTGAVNDDFTNLNGNADRSIGLDQAWFRYVRDFGSVDMHVTFGRQKNVFAYDETFQHVYDTDVRWDGLGWQWKFGMFGMNAAQYVTGARSAGTNGASSISYTKATEANPSTQSKFHYMFGFQPHMNWKFTDEIETFFAVAYYLWSDTSNTNTTGGGVTSGFNSATSGKQDTANAAFNVHNMKQWHFLNTWTLPYNLKFTAELLFNKKAQYRPETVTGYPGTITRKDADSSSWLLGLTYGSLKKAQDFSIGYAYGTKGLAASPAKYSNESFLPDNKGHIVMLGYSVADNFNIGWNAYFLQEKALKAPLTGDAYVGNSAGQKMKTTYMELTAGVNF